MISINSLVHCKIHEPWYRGLDHKAGRYGKKMKMYKTVDNYLLNLDIGR